MLALIVIQATAEIMSGELSDFLVKKTKPIAVADKIDRLLSDNIVFDFDNTYIKFDATNIAKQYINIIDEINN